jgi:hypothetical protein
MAMDLNPRKARPAGFTSKPEAENQRALPTGHSERREGRASGPGREIQPVDGAVERALDVFGRIAIGPDCRELPGDALLVRLLSALHHFCDRRGLLLDDIYTRAQERFLLDIEPYSTRGTRFVAGTEQ